MALRRMIAGLGLSLLFGAGPALASGGPDLDVLFIGSLTGSDANQAIDSLHGFRLGAKDLGGRLGGVEFTLTALDDRRDPNLARSLMEKALKEQKPQFVLLSSEPHSAELLTQLAAASHVFLINIGGITGNLSGKDCSSYLFSLSGLGDTAHEQMGSYLQGQGVTSVTAVLPPNPGAQTALNAFKRSYRGNLTELTSRRGEMTFESQLSLIKQIKPEGVYMLYGGGMAASFIRDYAQAGLKGEIPLFAAGSVMEQPLLAGAAPDSQDILSLGIWSEDADSPSNRRLMAEFEGEYGRTPSQYAALGYDAALLLDSAMRGSNKSYNNDEAVRTALRRADFTSTRGAFRFDTNQFPIQNYVLRATQKDNRERVINSQRVVYARDVREGRATECPMRWVVEPLPPPPQVKH